MKGLLHSKKFKANLRKWLFMYVGVMGLLTTVITYSKYITSMYSDDEARTSKFNIEITKFCPSYEDSCDNKVFRPTSTIPYYFEVEAKDIEVDATLILTFGINAKFTLESIDEIDSSGQIISSIYLKNPENSENQTNNGDYAIISTSDKYYIFSQNTGVKDLTFSVKKSKIDASNEKSMYRVKVKYNCKSSDVCDFSDDETFTEHNGLIDDAVQIGYSAIQNTQDND